MPCEVRVVGGRVGDIPRLRSALRGFLTLDSLIQPLGSIYLFDRNHAGCEICRTMFAGFKLPIPCKFLRLANSDQEANFAIQVNYRNCGNTKDINELTTLL